MRQIKKVRMNLLLRLLISYLLLVIIPGIVLASVSFAMSSILMKEKSKEIYDNLLINTEKALSDRVSYINELSTALLYSKRVSGFLNSREIKSVDEMRRDIEYFNLISELRSTQYANNSIVDIALYSASSDCVVSSNGIMSMHEYFAEISQGYSNGVDYVLDGSTKMSSISCMKSLKININERIKNVMAHVTVSHIAEDNGIVVFWDKEYLDKALSPDVGTTGLQLLLTDSYNNIIASTVGVDIARSQSKLKLPTDVNSEYVRESSAFPGKLYLYVPGGSAIKADSFALRFIVVFLVLFAVLVLVSIMITLKNYRPVKQFLKKIGTYGTPGDMLFNTFGTNEYEYIKNALDKLICSISVHKTKIDAYKKMADTEEIYAIINGKSVDKSEFAAIADKCCIRFMVVAASGRNSTDCVAVNEAMLVFSEGLKSEIPGTYRFLRFENIGGKLIVILGYEAGDINFTDEKNILDILGRAINRVYCEGINFTVGVGSASEGKAGMEKAYATSLLALDYRILKGCGRGICYSDICSRTLRPYYFPPELELGLLSAVKTFNLQKIEECILIIHSENLENRTLDIFSGKCLYFELYLTLLKALDSLEKREMALDIRELEQTTPDVDAILQLMTDIFKSLQIGDVDSKASDILLYVEENIYNPELSLNMLSEQFGIPAYSISRTFKQVMHCGFQEYVSRKRIEQAKRLIIKKDTSIAAIAKNVGFASSNSFIRIFRQYEGKSPGSMKDK